MKIKFSLADGDAIAILEGDNKTLEEAVELLRRDDVIKITVTKQTPAQYFKKLRTEEEGVVPHESHP